MNAGAAETAQLERLLVAVALGGDHHDRALGRRRPPEKSADVDDPGASSRARRPARPGCGPSASGRRRRRSQGRVRRVRRRPAGRPRSGRTSGCRSSRRAGRTAGHRSVVPEEAAAVARGSRITRCASRMHDRLGAGAADAAVAPGRSRVMMARDAGLARGRRLPPDHGGQRELLAAARQLGGLLDDLPALGRSCAASSRRHQSSVFTGGAPDTSCRCVSAS